MGINVEELLLSSTLSVFEKACLNFGNRHDLCTNCEQACPANAILIKGETPAIDERKCIDCGACVSYCPVLAIDHNKQPYQKTLNEIKQYSASKLTCYENTEFKNGIKIPCYLYLDLPLLLEYSKNNSLIDCYLNNCKTCHKADEAKVIDHLHRLEQQLVDLSISLTVRLTFDQDSDTEDIAINGFNRRDFFRKFSIANVRSVLNSKHEHQTTIDLLDLKDRLLLKKSVTMKSADSIKLTLMDVTIKECNGCSICTSICPTEALYWDDSEESSTLFFNISNCIECNRCLVCPTQSVRLNPIQLHSLSNFILEKKILHFKLCKECGDTFRTDQNEDTCPICRARSSRKSFFV